MNVLIIGGSGFIGRHLINSFYNQKQINVYYADLKVSKHVIGDGYYEGDIKDSNFIKKCIAEIKPDLVYYLASCFSFNSIEDSSRCLKNSQICLQSLFENLTSKQKLVYVGSSAQYGKVPLKHQPVSETSLLYPVSRYGVFKIFEEYEIRRLANKYKVDVIGARIFNITGPGEPERMVGGAIISQLKSSNKIKIGNLLSKRDFLDVRDVASALVLVGKKGRSGEVYNICSGKSVSIKNYLELISTELKIKPVITIDPNKVIPDDIKDLIGDNSKIKKELDWNIKYDISESIKDIVKEINC